MPGILYHLAFAEEIYRSLPSSVKIDKIQFMSGNLIPDLALDKNASHYRKSASVNGFFVPDMKQVYEKLYTLDNSIFFGIYCHLYLDNKFIEDFIIPEFIWDVENTKVINPRNKMEWDVEAFFSQNGMYGSYTEINGLLLRDGHVSMKTISAIPENLPLTGISIFDLRKQKTWKEEFYGYIAEKKNYTGNIFDYERLLSFIKDIAKKLTKELI